MYYNQKLHPADAGVGRTFSKRQTDFPSAKRFSRSERVEDTSADTAPNESFWLNDKAGGLNTLSVGSYWAEKGEKTAGG